MLGRQKAPICRHSGSRLRFPIAAVNFLLHRGAMTWLAEIIVQGFWEGAVEVAYHKWGWIGGAVALLGPFVVGGVVLWIIFG